MSTRIINAVAMVMPVTVALLLNAGTVRAAPAEVTLVPPQGARFLGGQRFDIRVEGKGTGPFTATLALDGKPLGFSSGTQRSLGTDGISSPGWGGFNLRGYSLAAAGPHTLTSTFSDTTGAITVSSRIEIVSVGTRDHHEQGRENSRPIKNIILMLGDGMGIAHRTAARLVKYGVTNGDPDGYLAMDEFPGTGFVTTHSLNSIVTDSSPGMSSYTTGSHVANGQEGVYPAHVKNVFLQPRVEYLAEFLHRLEGTALGLVTTADIEDATPAANAVHTGNRAMGTGICDQYLDESDVDDTQHFGTGLTVLMGGGRRWFLPQNEYGSSRTAATDYADLPADLRFGWALPANAAARLDPERNLLADFASAGFAYVDTQAKMTAAFRGQPPTKLLGLFAYGNMNAALDKIAKRRGSPLEGTNRFVVDDYHAPDQPMLDEMTSAALAVLQRGNKGFVLMVEGAHIDKQSHAMDAERVIDEVIEFDNAVAVARRFAEQAGDTLVLVLADHECAGFSLIGALTGSVHGLTGLASDAPVLKPDEEPARQAVVGTYDLAGFPRYHILADGYPETFDVDGKMLVGYGASGDRFETWLTKPLPIIDSLLSADIKGELGSTGYPVEPADRDERERGFFLRGQAAAHSQAVHTADDVPISAFSSDSTIWRDFVGIQRNTDVFFKVARAMLNTEGK